MSIKDRRERQKEATRSGILSAALEIAKSDGWSAVTIRRVAERVEYTPPIIYQYFENKDALLEELQNQGFALLTERLEAVGWDDEADTAEQLLDAAEAYVEFAYDEPELYQLMHGWSSEAVDLERTLKRASAAAEVVEDYMSLWVQIYHIDLPDINSALEIAWALLHGLVSVEMMGRIAGGRERVRQLARQGVENLMFAWASK